MNINPVLTEESLKKLYLEDGLSTASVAKKLGASDAGVRQAMIRYGIPLRSRREAALSQSKRAHVRCTDWKRMAERYDSGELLFDLAAEVGCSPATASAHLSEHTTLRKRGTIVNGNKRSRLDVDVDEAIRMNREGKTLSHIGESMGVSVQVLSSRFREVGVPVLRHRYTREEFANLQVHKRKVAQAIGADECVICSETRGVQLCHILARRYGGRLTPDNTVALCPNHHWFFDRGKLNENELGKLRPYLAEASKKGYRHHKYGEVR